MLYIISQVLGWLATAFRAGGMLAKKPMNIKLLVSLGNLGWMVSGILTAVRAEGREKGTPGNPSPEQSPL